jgi:nicotinamidase-related amidase
MNKSALIIIDIQNDITENYCRNGEEIGDK